MSKSKRTYLIIIVAVVAVICGAAIVLSIVGGSAIPGTSSPSAAESAASSTVAEFGQTLQQVSILAPNASTQIASTYAPYIAPTLLQQWEANPNSAPGRVVSSPWPDHIKIDSITAQGSGYVVDGEIVFMSSTGVEGSTPVVIQLVSTNGTWQIAAFQGQSTTQ